MRKMKVDQGGKLSRGKVSDRLPKLNVDAAGIGVGSEEHWVNRAGRSHRTSCAEFQVFYSGFAGDAPMVARV